MKPILSMCLTAGLAVIGFDAGRAADPAPKKTPMLKCEMRRIDKVEIDFGGKWLVLDIPDAADVTITNISDQDVNLGSNWGPRLFLDLRVKDPTGTDVDTEPLNSGLTKQSSIDPDPYILKPGKVFEATVDLLSKVPEEKRIPGTYKVVAVYTIGETEYKSAEVEIKWPWKKK